MEITQLWNYIQLFPFQNYLMYQSNPTKKEKLENFFPSYCNKRKKHKRSLGTHSPYLTLKHKPKKH